MHEDIYVSQLCDFNRRLQRRHSANYWSGWITITYYPKVYITENGYADIGKIANNGEIVDVNRIIYLRQHISQVMKAMPKGINIRGYLIWSLIGNFSQYVKSFVINWNYNMSKSCIEIKVVKVCCTFQKLL